MKNKSETWFSSWWVALIGLIASCIGIFTFVTSLESISQIWESLTKNAPPPTSFVTWTPTEINARNFVNTVAPAPTLPLIPTSLPTQPPLAISFDHPNVHIELVGGKPGVDIQIFAGGEIISDVEIDIFSAVEDVRGEWRSVERTLINQSSNPATGIVSAELEPGTYGITSITQNMWKYAQIFGRWGIRDPNGRYVPYQIIPFPVNQGMRTRITIRLGMLRVVIVKTDGSIYTNAAYLNLHCQSHGANGEFIKSSDCHSITNNDFIYPQTDRGLLFNSSPEGYRYFFVGDGPYLIFDSSTSCGGLITDITVGPDAVQDIVIESSCSH